MPGINSGVLHNAHPLSTERIKGIEKSILENGGACVYLNENAELCFSVSNSMEGLKDLAWDNGYELSAGEGVLTKKQYKKTGLNTFKLDKILEKTGVDEEWAEPERLEGDGGEYYTLAPTSLSFRSTEPLAEFQEVQVNGQTVDPANYTLEEGSTIVKLSIDYLKTLEKGNYEVAVVSENKTVKGDFTVAAPDLNEYGFYYNQPYGADMAAFGGSAAFFAREDGTYDVINGNGAASSGNYSISGNTIIASDPNLGTLSCIISDNGTKIHCNELATTFVLGYTHIVADEDYIYIYKEDIGGYEVSAIDKRKAKYGAIKTDVNGINTVRLSANMFENNDNMITAPIIPNTVVGILSRTFYDCDAMTSVVIPDSVEYINPETFYSCTSLTSIYYNGSEAQWNEINIGSNNDPLTNATRYYYSETQPTVEGNFWHYVNGVPAVWSVYVVL
jgi:hypothetical protein